MTTIKIRDKQWFEEHCELHMSDGFCKYLVPSCWTKEQKSHTISFLFDSPMWRLAGQVLVVENDDIFDIDARTMIGSRYFVSFWIPNWAIEWVKEEADSVTKESETDFSSTGIKCPTKEEALRICDIIAWASKQDYLGQTEAKDLCSKITYNNKGWI